MPHKLRPALVGKLRAAFRHTLAISRKHLMMVTDEGKALGHVLPFSLPHKTRTSAQGGGSCSERFMKTKVNHPVCGGQKLQQLLHQRPPALQMEPQGSRPFQGYRVHPAYR